ncbi:L-dopachrome tautomerase-related protein [Thioclava kandeliae]|uniref:L-dopachrome tautomerase-related protein n=1 Tax=Thioclava kandeliae TaxID=3070818 RepID=A0ABV1SHG6_9RHOB
MQNPLSHWTRPLTIMSLLMASFLPTQTIAQSVSPAPIDYGAKAGAPLTEVGTYPWLANAAALTSDGTIFLGLPRWPGYEATPGIAVLDPQSDTLRAFPGGAWNTWTPDAPTGEALVNVNTIHIFDDDTLWAVDQGTPFFGPKVDEAAAKVLQFDTKTGKLLRKIVLGPDILPEGGSLNDLRLDAENAYFTDSGLGGIVIVNLETGKALRRLDGHVSVTANPQRPPIGEKGQILTNPQGAQIQVHSDPIEISPDGQWLYYQPLSGPLYRVPTKALRDETLSEADLEKQVEFVYDTPPLVGTAMDSKGNLYMAEMDRPRITVLSPDGTLRVLAQDDRLWGPDAMVISDDRALYVPIPQTGRLAANRGPDGKNMIEPPFRLFRMALPDWAGDRERVPPVFR